PLFLLFIFYSLPSSLSRHSFPHLLSSHQSSLSVSSFHLPCCSSPCPSSIISLSLSLRLSLFPELFLYTSLHLSLSLSLPLFLPLSPSLSLSLPPSLSLIVLCSFKFSYSKSFSRFCLC